MNPDEILDIIREDQRQLDRTVADLKDQTSLKSSSAAQLQDQKTNHWGEAPTVKSKDGG